MAWIELEHDDCKVPTRAEVREVGAGLGSVWQCEQTGCGQHWKLVGHGYGDRAEWTRVWPTEDGDWTDDSARPGWEAFRRECESFIADSRDNRLGGR